MTITTISSKELKDDLDRVKKAVLEGPVFITDHGKATHVFLSIDEYHRIIRKHRNIVEALSMPELSDIEFDPPRVPRE